MARPVISPHSRRVAITLYQGGLGFDVAPAAARDGQPSKVWIEFKLGLRHITSRPYAVTNR